MTKSAIAFIKLDDANIQYQSFYMTMIQNSASTLGVNVKGFCLVNSSTDENDILELIQKQTHLTPNDYEVILIPSRETISKDVIKQYEFVVQCDLNNIEVRSVTDLSDNLVESILQEKNKMKNHSVELLAKSREGMFQLAKQGIFLGGQTPFGCNIEKDKRLSIKEDYKDMIVEMFTLYARGLSITNIARLIWDIYGMGHTETSKVVGKKIPYMKGDKIYAILTNTIYIGKPPYHRTKKVAEKGGKSMYLPSKYWIKSDVKIDRLAIVDEEIFNKVQEKIVHDDWHERLQIPNHLLEEFLKEDVFLELQDEETELEIDENKAV